MALNTKVITQVDQVLAIPYVYGGCQCNKLGCHSTWTLYERVNGRMGRYRRRSRTSSALKNDDIWGV